MNILQRKKSKNVIILYNKYYRRNSYEVRYEKLGSGMHSLAKEKGYADSVFSGHPDDGAQCG